MLLIQAGHKRCKGCKRLLPLESYAPHPLTKDGHRGKCLDCGREYQQAYRIANRARILDYDRYRNKLFPYRRRSAGLKGKKTHEWVLAKYAEQGGVCAICRRYPTGRLGLVIDHNHKTGELRALLCSQCNTALGMVHDDPDVAQAVADYLRQHTKKAVA